MTPRERRESLRSRIIAWSFVPTAIILAAVALLNFYSYQQVTENLVIERDRELARLSAGQLGSEVAQHGDLLASIARTLDLREGGPTQWQANIERSANRLAIFDGGSIILDSHGTVVASHPHRADLIDQDRSYRPYYRAMLHSQATYFSDAIPEGPGGAHVVAVAVPIIGPEGESLGTMVGMFRIGATSVSAFYASIVKMRLEQEGSAYLVDGQGRVIYGTGGEHIGEDLSDQEAVQRVLDGEDGSLRTRDRTGTLILASYAPVPGTNWGLVREENWSALLSSSGSYRHFLLLLLALGVAVPALVVTLGVRRITQPIQDLIRAAQDVAGGRFGRTISAPTGDEIEELAEQFNAMSAQLEASYAQLEQKVADRTRELATLNAIAEVVSRSLDVREVLNAALDKTVELTQVEAGAAYCRVDRGALQRACVRGLPPDLADKLALIEGSSDGEATHPAVRRVADYIQDDVREALQEEAFQIIVSVPLVSRGKVLGTIVLAESSAREFDPDELALLASIGQQIGVAVENAQLYERAEQAAAAAERSRLARDLHDAVTQTLFSASLIAEVLPRLWERNPDEGRRRLEELRQLTRGALAEMRTLLLELRPSALDEAQLSDLLRQLGESITGRARVPVHVSSQGECDVPSDVKVALYRIAQEALNNVAKHSGASEARIDLRCDQDGVRMEIADDGRGFDLARIPISHLGLNIMRERAESAGATLEIDTAPGEGTHVCVCWAPA